MESFPWFSVVAVESCWCLILARVPHRIEMFLPTGLQGSGTLLSLQSRRTSMRGGSNCVRLESPLNVRLIGMKAGIRSIFVTRQVMLLSWPLQPYGVAIGSCDLDDAA